MKEALATTRDERDTGEPPIGHLTITKVTREHHPIHGGGTGTIGGYVDSQLEEVAMRGEVVQSVEVEIAPEFWGQFAAMVNRQK